MKKRILSIIAALVMVIAMLPTAALPASAAGTYTVRNSTEFHNALAAAQDGDVIEVSGSFVVKNPQSNNDSLVINKSVTIRGGELTLWYAGILLGADVTFKDITLGLASNMRPAIMANGHTLILENVQRDPTCRYIHLFCGGQTGATQGAQSDAKQGEHGQIILKGNTNLGLANIYAGSISTDSTNNTFAKPATVTIDETVKGQPIEHIYACGALQTPTTENDWFDYEHEIAPPTPSTAKFPVSGNVTINLYGTAVKAVEGSTGTVGKYAKVTYNGTDYLNDGLVLKNIGGLTVQSGNLTPVSGSTFGIANAPLSVVANATLGLQNLGNVTVGNFTGGGNLVLGASQTLTVAGNVSGSTTVGVGGIFNDHSLTAPTVGTTYIDARNSTADSFTLAAYASQPNIKLDRSESGAWTATAEENAIIVNDFKLASAVLEASSGEDMELPSLAFCDILPVDMNYPFSSIPLTISVNNMKATMDDDGSSYTYSTSTLTLSVADNGAQTGEVLQISNKENEVNSIPAGTYVISVTVPATNSGTGQPITRTATLTVKAAGGGKTVISPPVSADGLVYNGKEQVGVPLNAAYKVTVGRYTATDAGKYTVSFEPAEGFTWTDGQTTEIERIWCIDKASNPNPPPSLSADAPTAYNGSDGKITGTTAAMEYSTDKNFTSPAGTACTDNETTGLAPGDYYVRIAETKNYDPGPAVMVTVPQGPVTVTSIAIATPAAKTAYKVGESLDVTGLTLSVTMSDGKTYTVPGAAGMVSGFRSSAAVASQTLTVTYGGKMTTYTISITEGTGTDPIAVTGVTLNKSTMTLTAGSSERLTATVSPADATNKTVTWASQNTAVATVDASGTVTAVSAGTAVITVTTADGGKTAFCTVTVSANGGGSASGGGSMGGGGSTVTPPKEDEKPEEKPTLNATEVFTDVSSGAWYLDAVNYVLNEKLMTGIAADTFSPNSNLTRAMLAQVLYNNEDRPNTSGTAFSDVASGAWYADAVAWAAENGIVEGSSNGAFAPEDNITREQLAVMLWRYAGKPAITADLNGYRDMDSASDWALPALQWAVSKGVMSGKGGGILDPAGYATRAEVAQMLMNYFEQ